MKASEITLVKTSAAFPEQYDALDQTGNEVGYIRLRRGYLEVYCPDAGAPQPIYTYTYPFSGLTEFPSEEERQWQLELIKKCIAAWWGDGEVSHQLEAKNSGKEKQMFEYADLHRDDDIVAVNVKAMPVMGELLEKAKVQLKELDETFRALECVSIRLKILAEAVDVLNGNEPGFAQAHEEAQDFTRSVVQSIHSAIHGKPRED